MFKEIQEQAVNDVFEHLGQSICILGNTYKAVIKNPDNLYELGDSQIVGQVADVSVKTADVRPNKGDLVEINSKNYRIYSEPLLDVSNLIWRFSVVLVGNE